MEIGRNADPNSPPLDTGEEVVLHASRLTVTATFGPSLFDDRFGLPRHAWCQIARFARTIIVDSRGLDHSAYGISIRNRIRQTSQNDYAHTTAEHCSRSAVIEGSAMTIGRKYFAVLVQVTTLVRQFDRDAACQRHVAFAVEQALTRIVHGYEGGRTRGLHVHARPVQIEYV